MINFKRALTFFAATIFTIWQWFSPGVMSNLAIAAWILFFYYAVKPEKKEEPKKKD